MEGKIRVIISIIIREEIKGIVHDVLEKKRFFIENIRLLEISW